MSARELGQVRAKPFLAVEVAVEELVDGCVGAGGSSPVDLVEEAGADLLGFLGGLRSGRLVLLGAVALSGQVRPTYTRTR